VAGADHTRRHAGFGAPAGGWTYVHQYACAAGWPAERHLPARLAAPRRDGHLKWGAAFPVAWPARTIRAGMRDSVRLPAAHLDLVRS